MAPTFGGSRFSRCSRGCRVIRWTTAASSGVWSSQSTRIQVGVNFRQTAAAARKRSSCRGLAKYLVLHRLRGAEPPEDADEETFLGG